MINRKGEKAPTSNAVRQAAYRARKEAQEKHEVRGIYATEDQTKKIKEFAESLNKI
jgi:hypothetical protein